MRHSRGEAIPDDAISENRPAVASRKWPSGSDKIRCPRVVRRLSSREAEPDRATEPCDDAEHDIDCREDGDHEEPPIHAGLVVVHD